jgi:hypothetical protein
VVAFTPSAGSHQRGPARARRGHLQPLLQPGSINNANTDFALFTGDAQSPSCTSYSRSQDNTTLSFNCYPLPSSAT